MPIALDQGVGIVVWSPLAGGWLSGKYRRDSPPPEDSRHAAKWGEPPIDDLDSLYDIIDSLTEISAARNVSPAQAALAWLLGRPGVTSVIVGARTDAQLADNLKAAELALTVEEAAKLEAASRRPLPYPYWHQNWTASDRLSAADLALHGPYLRK
jgi:aryl-alcohol dehydrogenase-like predicted oxidoreductase